MAALGLLETDLVTASDAEPLVDPDSLTATNPAATVTDARGGEATASRTVDESDGDAGPGAASDRPAGGSHLQS